jgi:hypothetical protein
MTPGARAVFRGGFEHAVRLGHRHLGTEHLLLALVGGDHPAAAVLRAHGLRPDRRGPAGAARGRRHLQRP